MKIWIISFRYILLVWLWVPLSLAQAATPATPLAGIDAASGLTPADADALIATLQNDAERAKLIKQLQLLSSAQKQAAPVPSPVTLFAEAGDRLQQLSTDVVTAATVVVDMSTISNWLLAQVETPEARGRLAEIGRNVGLILGAAILAFWLAGLLARPVRHRVRSKQAPSWIARLSLLFAELVSDALPISAFVAAAFVMLLFIQPRAVTASVTISLLQTVLSAGLILVLVRGVLIAPQSAAWQLFPITDSTAGYLVRWARRFVVWGIYGFGLLNCLWWLGVPGAVLATLQKTVALVVAILAITFISQNRRPVANWLRPTPPPPAMGEGAEDGAEAIVEPPSDIVSRFPAVDLLRNRLADIWHVLALLYVIGIYSVYALKIEGGFTFLLRSTVFTILLIAAVRLLLRGIRQVTGRGFAVPDDLKRRYPTLEERIKRYLPTVTGFVALLIWGATILAVLQLWGVNSFQWLGSAVGKRATGSAVTIGTVLLIALGIWEIVNGFIDRLLAGTDSDGRRIARSARMRTLLPLIRNGLWFTIMTTALLLILSEIGVNIAPLLAGAGVVGIAIGFGSQALVKDVITGLFILIEDTISVGDVVDFGNQHSGVVEGISVRTVRLRDTLGTLHTIPFSEITVVKNLTREYAYWLIDIGVPYSADTDRVMAIYQEVTESLKQDTAIGPYIVGDLDPIGVNALGASSIQVQARIKTLPLRQWSVGREFNRRVKRAFDAEGIVIGGAAPTLTLGPDMGALVQHFLDTQQIAPQLAPDMPT
jgi:small conductance mechanosensitive channel